MWFWRVGTLLGWESQDILPLISSDWWVLARFSLTLEDALKRLAESRPEAMKSDHRCPRSDASTPHQERTSHSFQPSSLPFCCTWWGIRPLWSPLCRLIEPSLTGLSGRGHDGPGGFSRWTPETRDAQFTQPEQETVTIVHQASSAGAHSSWCIVSSSIMIKR